MALPARCDGLEVNILPTLPSHFPFRIRKALQLESSNIFPALGYFGGTGVRLLLQADRKHLELFNPEDLHQ